MTEDKLIEKLELVGHALNYERAQKRITEWADRLDKLEKLINSLSPPRDPDLKNLNHDGLF